MLHLFRRADGDAHAAVAARVSGAVADENSLLTHRRDELLMSRSNVNENKVGFGWPPAQVEAGEYSEEFRARLLDLSDIPVEIGGVFEGCFDGYECNAVDAVWR